ncbi:MAG: hypothetical protein ACM3JG_11975 [Thiohalocapsa sp.]
MLVHLRSAAIGLALLLAMASGAQAQARHEAAMHHHDMPAAGAVPTLPGQDAFGAIQEIVGLLERDPHTDWSKVDLEALRQHLIDMNEVTLKADAAARPIEGGLEIAVTGSGRTLTAIGRMIPAWADTANGHDGWSTKAAALPNGQLVTVTAANPKEVVHIRGLGFIGLLASGSWHQPHHLAIATGEMRYLH